MTETYNDTNRVSVKTYVPEHQKAIWKENADRLDMSLSEFVRTMVQAGRRGFGDAASKGVSEPVHPRGNGLKEGVLDVLRTGPAGWDDLEAELLGKFEDRLVTALEELHEAGKIDCPDSSDEFVIVGE